MRVESGLMRSPVILRGVSSRTRMRPPCVKRQTTPYERIFCFFSALGFLAQSADGLVF